MTSNKTALTKTVEWVLSRKEAGTRSVKRMELQVAAEIANDYKLIVLDKESLCEIARQVGGRYITSRLGQARIEF